MAKSLPPKVTLDLHNYVRIASKQPYYEAIKSSKIELLWKVLCKQHFGITKRTVPTWKLQYERMISYIPDIHMPGTMIYDIDHEIAFNRIMWNSGKYLIKHMINIIPSLSVTYSDKLQHMLMILSACMPLLYTDSNPNRTTMCQMFSPNEGQTTIPTTNLLSETFVHDLMMLYIDDLCKLFNYTTIVKPEHICNSDGSSVKKQIHNFLNRLAHVLLIHFRSHDTILSDLKNTTGSRLCDSLVRNRVLRYVMETFFPYKPFRMSRHIHVYKPPSIPYRIILRTDITRIELLNIMGIRDHTVNLSHNQLYRLYRARLLHDPPFTYDAKIEFIMNVVASSGHFMGDTIELLFKCNTIYMWVRCSPILVRDIAYRHAIEHEDD